MDWLAGEFKVAEGFDLLKERQALHRETAKLSVQNARMLRTHSPALSHTALLPTEAPVVVAMSEQGRRYFEAHQSKRGRGEILAELRDAPQILMWKSLVQTLIESDMSEIAETDRRILETHAGE